MSDCPCPPPEPPADLIPAIAENAIGPRSAQGDTGSMEQHPIPDQIALDRYRKSAAAASRGGGLYRRVQLRPGNNADLDR